MTVGNIQPAISQSFQTTTKEKETEKTFMDTFKELKEDMREKIDRGENNEASFQIGAQSFTLTQWDNFLKKFDKAQDTIEKEIEKEKEKEIAKENKDRNKLIQ